MSLYAFHIKHQENHWFTFGYDDNPNKLLRTMSIISDKPILLLMSFECSYKLASDYLDNLPRSANGWHNATLQEVERSMNKVKQKFTDNTTPKFYAFYVPALNLFRFGYDTYIDDLYETIKNEFPVSVVMWQKTSCTVETYESFMEKIRQYFPEKYNNWFVASRQDMKPYLNEIVPALVRQNATAHLGLSKN
jgi:hypothetical protein